MQSGGTRATAGTDLSYPGVRLCQLPKLVPSLMPTYILATGLLPPLARKSGLTGTKVGARIKPEPEPGLGLMADVPKLKGNSQSQSRMQGLIVGLSR